LAFTQQNAILATGKRSHTAVLSSKITQNHQDLVPSKVAKTHFPVRFASVLKCK